MSVSGNEEMTNYYATIPIKKRKFPMFQYSPPPPDEQSSLPVEGVQNCLVDDKSSSICQESSVLSADIETVPNEDKKSVLETKREIPTNTNVKLVGVSQESSVLSADIGTGPNKDKKSVSETKREIPTNMNVNLVGANQESSVLSADIGTGLYEEKKSVSETEREIPTNTNVNLVGANADLFNGKANAPTFHFDSLYTINREENVLLSRDPKTVGVVKVDLPPNEAPATLVIKKEVDNIMDYSCTTELLRMPETVQMFLGTRELIVSMPMLGLNGSDLKQNLDKSYNTSLGLSINQDKCLEECKSSDVKSQVSSPFVQTDRLKWDLNTTMDDWEGPGADGDAPEPVFSRETKMGDINCTEPLISSSGVLGDISDAGQQFHGETDTICVPFLQTSGQNISDNSLQPGLSTLLISNSKVEPLASSLGTLNSCGVPVHSDTAEVLVSVENSSSAGNDAMKSEPYFENIKLDSPGNKCKSMGLPELVNKELLQRCSLKAGDLVTGKPDDVIEPRSIKSEPVLGIQGADVIPCMSVEKVVQLPVNVSSTSPSGLLTCPVPLKSGVATGQFEISIRKEVPLGTKTTQETSNMVEHVTENMDFSSHGNEKNEPRADEDMQYSNGPECAKSYRPLDFGGDIISDKKVKNVSADVLEEDFIEFDCKAENKNNIAVHTYLIGRHDISKDNKHGDCEHTAADVLTQNRKEEEIILNDYDGKLSSAFSHDDGNTDGIPYWSDGYVEDQGETSDDHIKECVDSIQQSGQITSRGIYLQGDQFIDRDSSFQDSSTIEESEAIKMAINVTQNRLYDLPMSDVQMGYDTKELSNERINGDQENKTNVSQMKDVKLKGIKKLEEVDPTLLKPDSSITVNDAATASNSGGNQSRIITLPQGSNLMSPCTPRFVTDRSLISTRRERYADEDETIFLQRNRVENYADGPRRFERGRFQSQPYRISRVGQIRGRGRGRGFRQRDEWDFDHNSSADIFDGPPNYRVPRHKHASTGGNALVEDDSYHINQSRGLGMGRGGIRPNRDVLPSFGHPSSRRFSTRVGDVTRTRGIQMVRRYPGNAFSSRCTDENEFRHDEKFTRDFSEDHTGPIFNSSRPTYQRFDNRFARGNRNLSNIPRRGLPRARSKSPVRYEGHQNGSWSSPERGSPDGRRLSRRCGSPYVARTSHDFLDVEPERIDQPRSANPDLRSPSNRIVPRNNRTLDIVDTRERTDSDEFGGPIHSGRYQDLSANRKGDERRKGGDRCGNISSFCPPYNADGGNLQFNSDERPRPVRFCTEDGSEFNERGNVRKRDFERRIKNRPGIAQSIMRNLEEGTNYRENKQVWHDDAFDDTSRMKRRY
ncbi:uncharacterized protein LOC141708225 [Apium graveolens]|uniref:uncharacterized protein LOC141708225 n=1 Tax=Apium graveolens TaxID=4045 RepID=UPI003D7BD656